MLTVREMENTRDVVVIYLYVRLHQLSEVVISQEIKSLPPLLWLELNQLLDDSCETIIWAFQHHCRLPLNWIDLRQFQLAHLALHRAQVVLAGCAQDLDDF